MINPGFLLISVLFSVQRADALLITEWVVVVFVSILFHELGHAAAFLAFGHRPRIELHAMGGTTFGSDDAPLPPFRQVATYLCGPLAGFMLGGVVYALADLEALQSELAQRAIGDLLWVNLGWGALNLLPILPLDGGGILRGFAVARKGEEKGEKAALVVSAGTASVAAASAAAAGWGYPALLALLFAVRNFQDLTLARERERVDRGYAALEEGRLDDALEDGAALSESRDAWARSAGRELRAFTYLRRKEPALARQAIGEPIDGRSASILAIAAFLARDDDATALLDSALARDDSEETASRLIVSLAIESEARELWQPLVARRDRLAHHALHVLARALWNAGRIEESLSVDSATFDRFKCSSAAYNAACGACRLGRNDEAVRWLSSAADAGWNDVAHLDADKDLASLRGSQALDAVRDRMQASMKSGGIRTAHSSRG